MFSILKKLFSNNKKTQNIATTISVTTTTSYSDEVNPSRELLKVATQLKKEKKYDEACEKLREAFSTEGSENLMAKERLRLPMYLQLAGKNDEGWRILNELNISYTDVYSQADIANQMRVFLQKEKKFEKAILFGAWNICKGIECYQSSIDGCISMADEMAKLDMDFQSFSKNDEIYAHTPSGNAITDQAYKLFQERIASSSSLEGVKDSLIPMLKKAKLHNQLEDITIGFSKYLQSSSNYDFVEVRDYFNKAIEHK